MTFLKKALYLLVLVFLLMGIFSAQPLNALTINPESTLDHPTEVSPPPLERQSELSPKLQKLLTKTQSVFDNALTKTQQSIADLPQQLETIATSADINVRQQIKKVVEEKQDDLENVADKLDDLAETLANFQSKTPELLLGVSQAQDSLNQLAQSINQLADTTEGLKSKSSVQDRILVQGQIKEIQKYLQKTRQNLENSLRPTLRT
ncbi:MAG: hypothetical protein ACK5CA_07210 [Cyanobacteriota bacterium]|jgi:methyl-accepting chemotaxis protein